MKIYIDKGIHIYQVEKCKTTVAEDEKRSLSQLSCAMSYDEKMCKICWFGDESEPVIQVSTLPPLPHSGISHAALVQRPRYLRKQIQT